MFRDIKGPTTIRGTIDNHSFGAEIDLQSEVQKGIEGRKFAGLDLGFLHLGFEVGYLFISTLEAVKLRLEHWKELVQDSFSDYLPKYNIEVTLENGEVIAPGLLSEDLIPRGKGEIFEFDERASRANDTKDLPLAAEASRWLSSFFSKINGSGREDIVTNINSLGDSDLKKQLMRLYDLYIEKQNRTTLPLMDPFLEDNVNTLLGKLKKSGWNIRLESLLVVIKRADNSEWPFERRLIIRDLGEGITKGDEGMIARDRDVLYHLLDWLYNLGKHSS